MKKLLIAAVGLLAGWNTVWAQSVVINEIRNEATATNDAVELVIVSTNTDLRGFIIKDFSSSGNNDSGRSFTFTTNALWSSLPPGAIVVLRNNTTATDVTVGGGDYNLDVGLANTNYFTASAGSFDIATDEIVMIKTNGSATAGIVGSVHALAGSTTSGGGTNYTAIATPKLRVSSGNTGSGESAEAQNSTGTLADFNGTDALGDRTTGSIGTWNNASNQAFIVGLRGGEVTITTNVQFTAASASVAESSVAYTVTVYKTVADGNVSGEVVLSGTALEGATNDFTISATTFTMNGVTTSATFIVSINNDTNVESSETIILTLANVQGGTVSSPSAFTLTITDDDVAPSAPEGLLAFRFNGAPHLQVTTKETNFSVSAMALTSGTIETNQTSTTNFPDRPYVEETGGWTSPDQTGAKAFTFTVTPDVGYQISITGISFRAWMTAAGPSALGYSIAGGLATYATDAAATNLLVISNGVSGVNNQTGAITIQIQGWTNGSRVTSGGGIFRLDDVVVFGTVAAAGDTPPVLAAIGNKTVLTNTPLIFAVTATPTDADAVTLTVSNALPSGATFGATNEIGAFEWTAPAPVGVYTMTFYAADNDGADSEQITITVTSSPVPPAPLNLNVWINELHYDNSGADINEGVEIAGPAGTDLSLFTVVWYDGSTGVAYSNQTLSGTIDNESGGFGALWFDFGTNVNQNENNSPDGLALVYNGTGVVQFLSYEGIFTAVGGAANGQLSTDIGVSESSATLVGDTLQLCGVGTNYTAFTWASPSAGSTGTLNACQTIPGGGDPNDTDADELPNDWETLYFGGATNAVASADDDGDGFLNIEEFVAGTIPVLPSGLTNYFRSISVSGGSGSVGYLSVTGRTYRLWSNTNLVVGSWQEVGTPQAGSGSSQTLSDSSGAISPAYRVTVEMTTP